VEALTLEILKTQLDNILSKLLYMTPLRAGGQTWPSPEVPSHLSYSAILCWAQLVQGKVSCHLFTGTDCPGRASLLWAMETEDTNSSIVQFITLITGS